MEVEEIQAQGCKFPRIGNGNRRLELAKIGPKGDEQYPDDDEEGEVKRSNGSSSGGGGGGGGGGGLGGGGLDLSGGIGRLWPSSRIVRVSRASGGKDRHSKVWTSKGLRDRRVRLSVNTAIQFYDLQDRLGYEQPSKAVEWLLNAAATSIADLPPINTSFPDAQQQLSDEKRSSVGTENGFESGIVEIDGDPNYNDQNHRHDQQQQQQQQQQHVSLSKSACSSTSETSKGSGLSLSRSESRIKARERAKERVAEKEKEKEKENDSSLLPHHSNQNLNQISTNSSFTELLTGGINSANNVSNSHNSTSPTGSSVHQNPDGGGGVNESNFFSKFPRQQWSSATMDYFPSGLLGPTSTRAHQSSSGFGGQVHLGNPMTQPLSSVSSPLFSITGDNNHHHHHHHPELQHFSFAEHLVPVVTAAGGNNCSDQYNLNFSISSSSGLAGFNRGTLQSNSSSPSLLPHISRFSLPDGSSNFFIGSAPAAAATPTNSAAAAAASATHVDNHHHFFPGFDARLQLFYGDHGHGGGRHSDQKGKEKN